MSIPYVWVGLILIGLNLPDDPFSKDPTIKHYLQSKISRRSV